MKQRASEILIVIGIIMLIPLWSAGEDTLPSPMPIERLDKNETNAITAGAIIERVSFIEGIVIHSANEEDPAALAKDGLWYDAIKAISSKIEASPKDPFYRQQRASLLEQVGLPDIAEYDLRQSRK